MLTRIRGFRRILVTRGIQVVRKIRDSESVPGIFLVPYMLVFAFHIKTSTTNGLRETRSEWNEERLASDQRGELGFHGRAKWDTKGLARLGIRESRKPVP